MEFPRTKEERDAIRAGVDKKIIERAKRTVFLGSLNKTITEAQIREFCGNYGTIKQINMPKSKGEKALGNHYFLNFNILFIFISFCYF